MSSTEGLHPHTVAMLQGSSHLRVQSSAEFQLADGAKFTWMYTRSTVAGAGNKGTISNRGITIFKTTGTGGDSTTIYTLARPYQGAYKKIVFVSINATSNRQRVVTSSKGVKIGTSNTSIIATSHATKLLHGYSVELLGLSTYQWQIITPASTLGCVILTSATG